MCRPARIVSAVPLVGRRFIMFGLVGFSGTIVNLVVLFSCQEYVFRAIHPEGARLNASLAAAIFVSTWNNFLWNRWWTWRDRKGKTRHGFFFQMGQYFLASWMSMFLQFVLTRIGARFVHYLAANVAAIVLAAIVTYVLNDLWTFALRKRVTTDPRDPI